MKRMLLLIAAGMLPLLMNAQQSMDLAGCLDYALSNAVSVRNAKLDEKNAVAKVRETLGLGLPQVNGAVNINHNLQLRRFFATYSEDSFFFGGQTIPGLQAGDVVSAQNFFQLKSGADAGLSVSQLIFNGSYFVGLQASQALKDLSIRTTEQRVAEVVEQVTKGYYLVVVNRERINLFDKNLVRVETLLNNTTALQKQGFAESIDVDRLRVALNNLRTEREKVSALFALSTDLLKFQMNWPMDKPLELAGDIRDLDPSVDMNGYAAGFDYQNRPEMRVLEVNRRLQELNISNNYAQAIPTLVAIGNFGYSTQSPNVSGLFITNTKLEDNGSVGPDKWYPYSFIGVSLNVPLFSGLQRTYRIQQEKNNLLKIENGIRQVRSGIDLEVRQAQTTYQNALRTMESQRENMKLAENISRVSTIKYEQGVGSNLEVIDAETSLKESQVNYYNALYDALVAKVSLDKAYGKLDGKISK
ncbi:MAG: TolC family protein [Bacteroidota bacterium]